MVKVKRIRVCKDGHHILTSEHIQEVDDIEEAEKALEKRFGTDIKVFIITQEKLSDEEKAFHDRYDLIIKKYQESRDESELRHNLMKFESELNDSREARKLKQSIRNLSQNINLIKFYNNETLSKKHDSCKD
jgi:hypothetical protein